MPHISPFSATYQAPESIVGSTTAEKVVVDGVAYARTEDGLFRLHTASLGPIGPSSSSDAPRIDAIRFSNLVFRAQLSEGQSEDANAVSNLVGVLTGNSAAPSSSQASTLSADDADSTISGTQSSEILQDAESSILRMRSLLKQVEGLEEQVKRTDMEVDRLKRRRERYAFARSFVGRYIDGLNAALLNEDLDSWLEANRYEPGSQASSNPKKVDLLNNGFAKQHKMSKELVHFRYGLNSTAFQHPPGNLMTPLQWACKTLQVRYIFALLCLGADPNAVDSLGQNCFHIVLSVPFFHDVDDVLAASFLLIEAGVDVNRIDAQGFTPFHYCLRHRQHVALEWLRNDLGLNLDVPGKHITTQLASPASDYFYKDLAQNHLPPGTPLFCAIARHMNVKKAAWLVKHGCSLTLAEACYPAPLIDLVCSSEDTTSAFAMFNFLQTTELRLTEADVARHRVSQHLAATADNVDILQALKTIGFSMTAPDPTDEGITPLLNAVKAGKVKAAKWLVANGASVAERDFQGRGVAFYLLENGGHEGTFAWLQTCHAPGIDASLLGSIASSSSSKSFNSGFLLALRNAYERGSSQTSAAPKKKAPVKKAAARKR